MKTKFLCLILSLIFASVPALSRADSQRIRSEFFSRLKEEQNFGAYELDVDVRRGIFTVTGSVASEISRARVGEIAETIAGVEKVRNQIAIAGVAPVRVAPVAGSVAEKILSKVEREIGRENYSLNVSENGGDILLSGSVDTTAGAQKIIRIAGEVAPGKRISNQLQVKEELLTNPQLEARVLTALKREPLIRTDDLQIVASQGVVEITGTRSNHREIDRILSVVVMVEGVKDVRSKLRIGS